MSQPPSQQPPQGGTGSQGPRQEDSRPPVPPQEPAGAPEAPAVPPQPPTPPAAQPAQPGHGGPPAPGQQPGPYAQQPGPYGQQPGPYTSQPGPYGQQPGPYPPQPNPYAQQPGPYGGQPGPYAQQPGPYGGHPGAPQYPGAPVPPAPGGGRSPSKGRTGVVVGAAVAALLVIGAGTWFALSGDEAPPGKPDAKGNSAAPDPTSSVDQGDGTGGGREANDDLNAGRKPGEAKVDWIVTNDVDLPRNGSDVFGPWIVGDTVVKGMYKSITAHSLADGKKKWEVPFDTELCAAPVEPSAGGLIAVAVKESNAESADCTHMQQVDLKTGKAGWKKPIPRGQGFSGLFDVTMAISGNTVTAAGTGNSYGFSLTDGKQLFGKPTGDCRPYAFAGGPKLIAAADCRTGDVDKQRQQVLQVDPATGKPLWTYEVPPEWEVDKIYSVSPLVVSLTEPDEKKWSVIALTDTGTLRSQIDGGKDKFNVRCGGAHVILGQNLQGCSGVAADAGTFYMSTEPTQLVNGTNDVIAFDLDTGKPKWRSPAGPERSMTVLRVEGGNVLTYVEGSYDRGGAVATIAPTGGAPKVVLQHPASTAEIENSFFGPRYLYDRGRFIIAEDAIRAGNDAEEKQAKAMISFSR